MNSSNLKRQKLTIRRLFWIPALLSLAVTGCVSRPQIVRETFAFTSPSAQAASAPATTNVLALTTVTIAAPYDEKTLIYRTGEQTFERDFAAEFMGPPARLLGEALRAGLRQGRVFTQVTEPGSALKPNLVAEVHVSELYGDFSKPTPEAVLTLRILLFDASHGLPETVREQLSFTRRIPIKERTASQMVAAWNTGLDEIVTEANQQLRAKLAREGQ